MKTKAIRFICYNVIIHGSQLKFLLMKYFEFFGISCNIPIYFKQLKISQENVEQKN